MDTGEYLSLDASGADFIIDVANVVREDSLTDGRPADLSRLALLCEALAGLARDPSVQIYAMADESLLYDKGLSRAERESLGAWAAQGLLEVLPSPDGRILELAHALDMPVVSGDNFYDFHDDFPWVAGNTDTFLLPVPDADGTGVDVVPRIMPVPARWQVSRKLEESELKRAGMYDRRGGGVRREALSRRWRCSEPKCRLFGGKAGAAQPYPRYRNGAIRCPEHLTAMTDIGPAPERAQLKAIVGGTVRSRFTVIAGTPRTVGRATGEEDGIDLWPWLDDVGRRQVSRRHLTVDVRDGAVRVRDTSMHGSVVQRPGGDPVELRNHQEWALRRGHSVRLHTGVEVQISGRKFPFVEPAEQPGPAPLPGPQDVAPTLIRPPSRDAKRRRRGKGGRR